MKFHRRDRVASLIASELSTLLLRDVEFTGAVVTVVRVEVTEKLEEAHVTIGVFPPEKGPDVLVQLLRARSQIQFKMSRKLNIKPMPKIMFQLEKESIPA